jgi:glucose-1-phosphate thymidylyltransferase
LGKDWFAAKDLKCVVLCAGAGKRILSQSAGKPKVMLDIDGTPILGYVVDYWKRFTRDFIFVVGYQKEQVIDYASQLPLTVRFVEQKELKGIANAVLHVRELILDRFILVLGDCVCKGDFNFPTDMDQGVGIWRTQDKNAITRSYSIELNGDLVASVKEKPKEVNNDLCGMGFYFFDKRLFRYIEQMKPSALRGEVEITDTIQYMIDCGEKISPVYFEGDYLNITYPDDLILAARILTYER